MLIMSSRTTATCACSGTAGIGRRCACRKLDPYVLMMQSTQDWQPGKITFKNH